MDKYNDEKKCHQCGKEIIVNSPGEWVYKRYFHGNMNFFCSWSCLREFDRKRGTKAERRQKILDGLMNGMTVEEISKKYDIDKSNVMYWKRKMVSARE